MSFSLVIPKYLLPSQNITMAAHMEDGEITDSESDSEQQKVLLQRDTTGRLDGATPVPDPRLGQMRKVPGLSSSDDSDSEDEPDGKRMYRQKAATLGAFKNPLLESSRRGPAAFGFGDDTEENVSQKSRKLPPSYRDLDLVQNMPQGARKKKTNLWGAVLTEQEISRDLGLFGVEANDLKNDWRDVESYDYKKVKKLKQQSSEDESAGEGKEKTEMEMEAVEDDEKEAKGQEALFDIETFGKIESKCKPSIKDRLGKKKDSDDSSEEDNVRSLPFRRFQHKQPEPVDFTEELKRYKLKRKRVDEKKKRKGSKNNQGKEKRTFGEEIPRYTQVSEEDSKEKIVATLVENLQEPKVALMSRVFDVLGARKTLGLMAETLSIEETGGLMINDGSRRRTPGGVFFFLLRNDKYITKSDVIEIFKEEQAIEKMKQKERKVLRAQRMQQRQKTWKRPQDIWSGAVNTGEGKFKDERQHVDLASEVRKDGDGKSAEAEGDEEGEVKDDEEGEIKGEIVSKQEAAMNASDDELDLELDLEMDVQLE